MDNWYFPSYGEEGKKRETTVQGEEKKKGGGGGEEKSLKWSLELRLCPAGWARARAAAPAAPSAPRPRSSAHYSALVAALLRPPVPRCRASGWCAVGRERWGREGARRGTPAVSVRDLSLQSCGPGVPSLFVLLNYIYAYVYITHH